MFSAYHYTNFDTMVSFVYMVTVGYHVNAIGQTQLIDQQILPKGKCGHQQCSVKEYYINFIFQEISYAHLLFLDFPLSFIYLFIYLRPFMQLLMESHLLNFAVVGNGE